MTLAELGITLAMVAGISALVAVGVNGLNNWALGRRFFDGAGRAAFNGAIIGTLAYCFPFLGLILAGVGIASAANTAYQVFSNRNATAGQVGAAIFLLGLSLFGAYAGARNVQESSLWVNADLRSVNSASTSTYAVGRAVQDTADRVGEFQEAMAPYKFGSFGTTYGVCIAENSSGGRVTIIATNASEGGRIRPQVQSCVRPGDIIIAGTSDAEANIVAFCAANGLKPLAIGATRAICNECTQTIVEAGATCATPVKSGEPPLTLFDLLND